MKNPSLPTIPNISSSSVFILFASLGPLSYKKKYSKNYTHILNHLELANYKGFTLN